MSKLNRRSFLAAGAALLASPALGAAPIESDVDIVVVGAGAAGIAAARRLAAAKQHFAVFEAADHIGGRCVTDTTTFGVPFDRGAHWIHQPDVSPLLKPAPPAGFDVYSAPRGQSLRVGPRPARDSELENFLTLLVRSHRSIAEAARGQGDMSAASALPTDLGGWRSTIEFVLGPYTCAKALSEVSADDFARQAERDVDAFCRQGYGALLQALGAGLPVRLGTPVRRVIWGRGIAVDAGSERIYARAAIVTASTDVLASGKIEFSPPLDKRQLDALASLKLGSYEHIALELPGNPLGLQRDDLLFEKSDDPRTAALLANVSGTDLHVVTVAGNFGRTLAAQGEPAMIDFARDWLASMFGSGVKSAIKRTAATRWGADPFVLGGFSAAAPDESDARNVLGEPLGGRLWFAGEAVHETLWGTVGGAWQSGVRAAEAALRHIGALNEREEEKETTRERKKIKREPRRSRRRRREQ
jgi:monoamine oxidase